MSLANCLSATFTFPHIPGTNLVSLSANVVNGTEPTVIPQGIYTSHPETVIDTLSFCNVSVTYSHPGYNDMINTYVFLPSANTWNGRVQGVGGGGFVAGGLPVPMLGAVDEGYVAVSTDGGHHSNVAAEGVNPNFDAFDAEWAVLSPGNSNLPVIQDFATTSVRDTATIGKSIATAFYGEPPKKAYWNGCSQGGRQGYMLAQRYPDAYDGILGVAPAINWGEFFPNMLWPVAVMNSIDYYPSPCEMKAITLAAIDACDGLDGVMDGVISRNDLCNFDANTVIGKEIECDESGQLLPEGRSNITSRYGAKVSAEAATVMNLAWQGSTSAKGEFEWYGFTRGTLMPGILNSGNTFCVLANENIGTDNPFQCFGLPFVLAENWIKGFVYAIPANNTTSSGLPPWSFNVNITSREAYDEIFKLSLLTFGNWLQTTSINLDNFRQRGGKLLSWHGGTDQLIVPNGTTDYYERVLARDRSLHVQTNDYYRFFEAPGVEHCFGGPGPYPGTALDSLVKWVEGNQAPETLDAASVPDESGQTWKRQLCLYPKKQVWGGQGNPREPAGWSCQ